MSWDAECDVVVVGSGGGALIGAYVAGSKGLRTILVESTDKFGGTTAYSGSGMWLPTNPVLKRAGFEDTLEAAKTYYRAVVGDRTPRDLQDAFLENGAPMIAYLEQNPLLKWEVFPWPDYFGSAPSASGKGHRHIISQALPATELGDLFEHLRAPVTTERQGSPRPDVLFGGQALIGRLLAACRDTGRVELRHSTPMEALIVENGRVAGIVAKSDGKPIRIKAARGVLMAAGGFEQNAEMRKRFGVPATTAWSMGAPGSTGRPIEAGIEIGAATDLMGECWWSPGLMHPDGTATFSVGLLGGIFVNGRGERFVNESQGYDRLGRKVIADQAAGLPAIPFWQIYDARFGQRPPVMNVSVALAEPEAYIAKGLWKTADTIEGLAEQIGVPAAALKATIDRFNAFARSGIDEDYHRGEEAYDKFFVDAPLPESNLVALESPDFGDAIGSATSKNANLIPIDKPPFYAASYGVSDLGTKGGLRTDAKARVLRPDGTAIRGLYAAGNTQAAVSGLTYPAGGNPIGSCAVFAYLAALDMAVA